MASRRPSRLLSELELQVWDAMRQPVPMKVLRDQFSDSADEIVREFWRSELCEFVAPTFPEARRRILVIEPHADDAALSVGGAMWLRRNDCAFVIATMASRSNFTSYFYLERDYFNVEHVMNIRRSESELFARIVGGRHVDVGLTDAVLRYCDSDWSMDFFQRHRVSIAVATSRSVNDKERERWVEAVRRLLAETPSEEVWIPLGIQHTDHILTANACLAAFALEPSLVAGRTVRMYEDVPYAAQFPVYTAEALANRRRAGVELDPERIPIDDVFEKKLRIISMYASQFKMDTMRDDIEACALAHGSAGKLGELLWRVDRLPDCFDSSGITLESAGERNQDEAAELFVSRNREAGRVRVLLLVPTGRWPRDLEVLCEQFPCARFHVFVAPAAVAEVLAAPRDRVDLSEVDAGSMAWGLLSLQLAVARPVPTLFHVGDHRLRAAKWLSRLWFRSSTLVVASMDHVMRAWERRAHSTAAALESRPSL